MERGSDGFRTEDEACLPSIRVRCAGIRADNFSAAALNARGRGLGSETNHTRLFFTEKQYAASPFLVRVRFDSVAFVHRGTHVVERRFVFPGRVLHAILSDFAPSATTSSQSAFTSQGIRSTRRQRGAPLTPRIHPHLCVLVRSDCLNVYTAAGDVFEVALPFQANRLFAMKGGRGLLLQRSPAAQIAHTPSKRPSVATATVETNRRASTSNRGDGDRYNYSSSSSSTARPRYFTLSHPLDEVKPVALISATATAVSRSGEKKDDVFLSDSALEAVAVLGEGSSPVLVTFHRWEQRFCVFRMKMATPQGCQAQDVPRVRVVDGPAWTKYRARIDLEELRVRIEPDWMATSLWKSPRLDRPTSMTTFLSPILSPPSAEVGLSSPSLSLSPMTGAGGVSKSAFVATDVDGLPLLCMMDKDTSTLFLKPFSLQNTSAEAGAGDSEVSDLRALQCRDAIPIYAQSRDDVLEEIEGHVDIVVLRKDGTLVLHQADRPVCRLMLPDESGNFNNGTNSDNFPERARLASAVQLRSIEAGAAFEIVFPEFYGVWSGKLWRCEHPLKIVSSPLLQQTFEVLACVLASPRLDTLKAHVIYRAQQKAQHPAEDEELGEGGYEWQSFRECMITLLLPQSAELEEEDIDMDEEGVSSSFDTLCQSEYHDLYQYENSMLFATMELPTARTPKRHLAQIPTEEERGKAQVISALQEHVEAIFAALHLLCEDFKLSIVLSRSRLQLADLLLEMATLMDLEPFVTHYKQDNCVFRRGMISTTASSGTQKRRRTREEGLLCFATYGRVPGIIEWLHSTMATGGREEDRPFPGLLDDVRQERHTPGFKLRQPEGPLLRTMALCRIYELLFSSPDSRAASLPVTQSRDDERAANMAKLMIYLTQDAIGSVLSLDDLPVGLSFPIMQAIRQVKHSPPLFLTEDVCAFIGREDLGAGMGAAGAGSRVEPLDSTLSAYHHQRDTAEKAGGTHLNGEDGGHDGSDGLDEIITRSQRLFPADQRMKEVARLLRSSRPLCLKLEKTPDMSDLDYAQQHQARLLLLCKRSMALSVARGMVTLGSVDVSVAQTQAWQLRVPALPLAGRKPPANAIVELDLSGYAKELTYWPQFHNGCATGLRLPAHDLSGVINRHWIKYHRPSVSDLPQRNSAASSTGSRQSPAAQSTDAAKRNLDESYASHAGLLLGIGLRGHLKCLSMADVYNYLSLSNEFVTVAIMLGMASTAAHCRRKRKQQAASINATTGDAQAFHGHSPPPATSSSEDAKDDMMSLEADGFLSSSLAFSSSSKTPLVGMGLELALERSVSKMLCLHVPSLLPPPFAGFSVPVSTQTAALLGLGILYQGTGYRLMTELLLTEIARSPSSAQFVGSNSNTGLSTASFGQLEGYSLAAGMALGLVVLGRGQTSTGDPGLADLKLEEKLHKYIVGGAQQYRDTNAAGSCLYRGRRWQTFGNGGGRLNAGVNGAAGSGASANSTEASPGADREAKHTQDRGGLRGGGEHVNIGVTACSSALALAFMYMQTNNKTVAAQLEVPDTLILLDYVRPDILLVRTLAKNLIMWSDVSPTTQWIEQHEVPAQLQQAYKALTHGSGQNGNQEAAPSGLPAHADVHSICESYANIVAGACLSIGLRFAGTASASARETLRKYVLHFRELRSKASSSSMILRGSSNVVAAATERVTVERCLAVCAQSLALVDAGTGNVETLALLRSLTLRQRVDAAMTYGNHMALSMAIGLLFLGGGRATLSRSKEAIAALVISLYPMVPMNTADNKYHLQAFRHLYVLAVDNSRLLETVDVNAKANCAVQVRLELHPDGGRAAESSGKRHLDCQQLRTPCLLPELATIKRLVISDPEFYPVEILMSSASDASDPPSHDKMRTANALRLELLRSSNVVLLKRRKRQDSIESLATFTDELQQLHNLHLGAQGGKDDDDNQLLRLFRSYFAANSSHEDDDEEDGDDDFDDLEVADWGSGWWASQLSPRALEQVREETQLLLPSHFNALHALFRLQQVPHLACTTEITTLRLFCDYYRSHMPASMEGIELKEDPSSEDPDRSLGVGILEKYTAAADFGAWLSNQTEEALRALWQRSSLAITSLASARVQLLVESPPSTSSPPLSASRKAQQALDAFLMDALVRYFAGASSSSLSIAGRHRTADRDWKAKFQRVLAACSQTQQRSANPTPSSRPQFQLAAFLEQDELTEAEKTFWLKLVSFFLFST
ncbi:hypothetical protein BBJ28_00006710 [Nothophytophthora sp. Chile5]|nr:hypothetical protein BBJ28_00006710 [Nothophytophthora sp. Chile5]